MNALLAQSRILNSYGVPLPDVHSKAVDKARVLLIGHVLGSHVLASIEIQEPPPGPVQGQDLIM
jgi:hypothetical protein